MEKLSANFLHQVCNLLENARKNVKTAVNLSMVYTYYEIGHMIIEEEQKGNNRADYGKYGLKRVSSSTPSTKMISALKSSSTQK